jgi:hypothetical protein
MVTGTSRIRRGHGPTSANATSAYPAWHDTRRARRPGKQLGLIHANRGSRRHQEKRTPGKDPREGREPIKTLGLADELKTRGEDPKEHGVKPIFAREMYMQRSKTTTTSSPDLAWAVSRQPHRLH